MLLWQLVVLLPSLAAGFLFDSIGVIDPRGDLYLRVGEDLALNCTLTGYNTPLDASYLYFTRKTINQSDYELVAKENLQILGRRKIGLKIDNAQLSDSGMYFCALNESLANGEDFKLINHIYITVSEPPRAIRNLTCVSDNYEDMMCDWCDQVEPGVNYELQWRLGENVRQGTCQIYEEKCRCRFCWTRQGDCTDKAQDFFHNALYTMSITAIRYNQKTVSADFKVHASFKDIVKPRPPSQLFVNEVGSTNLALSWTPPPGFENPQVYPMDYIVSYTSSRHPEVTKNIFVVNKTSVNLTDLHPYTEYNISVVATPDMGSGYHSDKKSQLLRTRQSEPSAPPSFLTGSFRIKDEINGKRRVIIFFGEIPKDKVNGELTGFRIVYTALQQYLLPRELFSPNNKYTKELLLDSDKTYKVAVAGHTIADGVFSSIYIPKSKDVLPPKHVEGVVSENATSVQFTVIPTDGFSVNNYTLLYCHGHLINGIPDEQKCRDGALPVAQTYPGNRDWLRFDGHQPDLVYGIAVNYDSSTSTTSGLSPTWLCLYDYDGDPLPPVISYPEVQNESSITLEWERPKCSRDVRGRVSFYQLVVYLEQKLIMNVSIDARFHEKMVYSIPNLKPYTVYDIELTACTVVRCSLASHESRRSPESAPEGPPLNVIAYYQNGRVMLAWQPPASPNGIILLYHIYITNISSSEKIYRGFSTKDTKSVLYDLLGYTNYSVQIQAENGAGKSVPSDPVLFSIPVKAPGRVEFKATLLDQSTVHISCSLPQPPNGPKPEFLLITSQEHTERNYTISREHDVELDCSDGIGSVNLSVLAINTLENGTKLEGPLSEEQSLRVCSTQPAFQRIVVISVAIVALIIIMTAITIIFCKRRDHCLSEHPEPIMPQVDNNAEDNDAINYDSDVSNPQSTNRSLRGSVNSDEENSYRTQVSLEDDRNISQSPTSSVRSRQFNQSTDNGETIEKYTRAAKVKRASDEEDETDHDVMPSDSSADHSIDVWLPSQQEFAGYKQGITRKEEIQFEMPYSSGTTRASEDLATENINSTGTENATPAELTDSICTENPAANVSESVYLEINLSTTSY